jgi:hypothetical protein
MLDTRYWMLDAVPVKAIPPRLTGVKPGSNLPGFEMLDAGFFLIEN